MIISKNGQIHFEGERDYKFMKAFEELIEEYCGDNSELRKNLISNFCRSFKVED